MVKKKKSGKEMTPQEREEAKERLEEKIDELEEMYDELSDVIEELDDDIEETYDEIEERDDEIKELEEEIPLEDNPVKRERLEGEKEILEFEKIQFSKKIPKLEQKQKELRKKREEVREKIKKAKGDVVRMNISLPEYMRDDWKDLAKEIDSSVSEILRGAMSAVTPVLKNLKSLKDLEKLGDSLDKWGEDLERKIETSAIEDIGKNIEIHLEGLKDGIATTEKTKPKTDVKGSIATYKEVHKTKKRDIERIKKRLKGLIKLQKSLPVSKLAQVLDVSEEKAENLIYELAAEGIDGELDEGVFKFTNPPEKVIEMLFTIIEKNHF